MKKLIFTLSFFATALTCFAQALVADQNPNYKQSMDKYAGTQVALQTTNNTTIQDTYTAYDFSTAKSQRKAERLQFRRSLRLYNAMNNGWGNNQWNNGWNNNQWNNGFYNNNNGRNNFNNCSPFRWIW